MTTNYSKLFFFPRTWRNWQTRSAQDAVGNTVEVRVLSSAPSFFLNKLSHLACTYAGTMHNPGQISLDCEAIFAKETRTSYDLPTSWYYVPLDSIHPERQVEPTHDWPQGRDRGEEIRS